ncbi:RNase A-like domain-containing protein [Curtobacterium pusillum]|uniref:RNase A-like domain-containing protein n=1 Tax=Curtobacterium pusillum TaxID=69373 RepID=UPI003814615E
MSDVGYGDHGLVDPDGIPGADLDLAAVSSGAGTIKSGGQSMKTVADDLPAKWQRLSGVYESPESEQVFALMDPVTDDVHTIGTVARKVASALETYASAAADPKRKLDELRVEAAAFVAKVEHGVPRFESAFTPKAEAPVSGSWNAYQPEKPKPQSKTVPWYEDVGTRYENDQLIQRINEQVALLQAAQAECALAIKKAAGASVKKAFKAPSESDLNARGVDLPWSRVGTAEGKTWAEQFEDGFKDDLLKTLSGLLHLGGWDNSGDWSWGNLGSAWKGAADGAVAFSLLVDPMAWLDAAVNPKGQAGQTLGAMGDAAQDWWKDAREHPGIAAGAAASAVGTSFLGPEGWAGRAGRAEELASGLGKLGAKDLARSVEEWSARGVAREHLDALAKHFDDSFEEWARAHKVGGNPFDDAAFKQIWDDKVEAYQRAHPEFDRHGIESRWFTDQGGLQGVDQAGGHIEARHIRTGREGEAFDEELRSRFKGKRPSSAYTVDVSTVDENVAKALDYNHEAITRWVDDVRNERVADIPKSFEWPSGEILGRGFDPNLPGNQMYDGRTVLVAVRYDPSGPPYYKIRSSYPIP